MIFKDLTKAYGEVFPKTTPKHTVVRETITGDVVEEIPDINEVETEDVEMVEEIETPESVGE